MTPLMLNKQLDKLYFAFNQKEISKQDALDNLAFLKRNKFNMEKNHRFLNSKVAQHLVVKLDEIVALIEKK